MAEKVKTIEQMEREYREAAAVRDAAKERMAELRREIEEARAAQAEAGAAKGSVDGVVEANTARVDLEG